MGPWVAIEVTSCAETVKTIKAVLLLEDKEAELDLEGWKELLKKWLEQSKQMMKLVSSRKRIRKKKIS